jgi:hypothetical protein
MLLGKKDKVFRESSQTLTKANNRILTNKRLSDLRTNDASCKSVFLFCDCDISKKYFLFGGSKTEIEREEKVISDKSPCVCCTRPEQRKRESPTK